MSILKRKHINIDNFKGEMKEWLDYIDKTSRFELDGELDDNEGFIVIRFKLPEKDLNLVLQFRKKDDMCTFAMIYTNGKNNQQSGKMFKNLEEFKPFYSKFNELIDTIYEARAKYDAI